MFYILYIYTADDSYLYFICIYITKYGSTLYIGMDEVLAHYAILTIMVSYNYCIESDCEVGIECPGL